MKKILSLSALMILLVQNGMLAQNIEILDSLHAELSQVTMNYKTKKSQDTVRINLYFDIIYEYYQGNPDSTKYYYNCIIEASKPYISDTSDDKTWHKTLESTGISYYYLANFFDNENKVDTAEALFIKAKGCFEELDDQLYLAYVFNRLGILYYYQGKYKESISNYNRNLEINLSLNDSNGIATAYNNIGIVYMYQGKYDEASNNYNMAKVIFEVLDDKDGLSRSYGYLGLIFMYQAKYEAALTYLFKKKKIAEELRDSLEIASSLISVCQ